VATDEKVLELFRRAAADRRRGASEIEKDLVQGLLGVKSPPARDVLAAGVSILAEGQPAMANLRSLAARAADPGFAAWLRRRAEVLAVLAQRLAANAWSHVEGSDKIVTISRSTAVAAVVEGARERGWKGLVVVLDGTATGRGGEQAQLLSRSVRVVSQPDAAAPRWLDESGVVVLVGADAVGPLRFINATGTRMLLELAAVRELKRVLVADTGKNVSEGIVDEIVGSLPVHREAPDREWPVFEVAPLTLVSARVTE